MEKRNKKQNNNRESLLVNNNLYKLRTEKGLTQSELAKIVGSTQQTISNYETGYINTIDATVEDALAKYFSCSIDYLRGNSKIKNPEEYVKDAILLKNEFIKLGIIKDDEDITDEQLSLFRDLIKANKPFFKRYAELKKANSSNTEDNKNSKD